MLEVLVEFFGRMKIEGWLSLFFNSEFCILSSAGFIKGVNTELEIELFNCCFIMSGFTIEEFESWCIFTDKLNDESIKMAGM